MQNQPTFCDDGTGGQEHFRVLNFRGIKGHMECKGVFYRLHPDHLGHQFRHKTRGCLGQLLHAQYGEEQQSSNFYQHFHRQAWNEARLQAISEWQREGEPPELPAALRALELPHQNVVDSKDSIGT